MTHTRVHALQALPNDTLLARLPVLAARERGLTAELVAHLAELETRGLHLAAGYSSMFAYCREALRLSEHEAYNRIEAARAARRFPAILERLAAGDVTLTTVRLLAPHLTTENHAAVLDSARHAAKPMVEEIVARLAPAPDVPTTVRKLPVPRTVFATSTALVLASAPSAPVRETAPPPVTMTAAVPAAQRSQASATVGALSPDRYKLQLTVSGAVLEKLRMAKDLLRHAVPDGNEAEILDRALTALLAEQARKKLAATDAPRTPRSQGSARSRHVPAAVRRAVFARDRGRCAFAGAGGRRCGERAFLELHHVRPYAEGGLATADKIELRCRNHNTYEWRRHLQTVRAEEAEWRARESGGAAGRAVTRSGMSAGSRTGVSPAGA